MKDKGFIFALCFLTLTGAAAWIIEGFNVYTAAMIGLIAFLLIMAKYDK